MSKRIRPSGGHAVEAGLLGQQLVDRGDAQVFLLFGFGIIGFGNAVIKVDQPLLEGGQRLILVKLGEEIAETGLWFQGGDDDLAGAGQPAKSAVTNSKPAGAFGSEGVFPQPAQAFIRGFLNTGFGVDFVANGERLRSGDMEGVAEGAGLTFGAELAGIVFTLVQANGQFAGLAFVG